MFEQKRRCVQWCFIYNNYKGGTLRPSYFCTTWMCDHVIFTHHDPYTLDVWQTTLTTLVYFCKELYLQENVDKQLGIVENVKICITDKFNKLTFWRSMFYPMFKLQLVHLTMSIKILYHDPKVQKKHARYSDFSEVIEYTLRSKTPVETIYPGVVFCFSLLQKN